MTIPQRRWDVWDKITRQAQARGVELPEGFAVALVLADYPPGLPSEDQGTNLAARVFDATLGRRR